MKQDAEPKDVGVGPAWTSELRKVVVIYHWKGKEECTPYHLISSALGSWAGSGPVSRYVGEKERIENITKCYCRRMFSLCDHWSDGIYLTVENNARQWNS